MDHLKYMFSFLESADYMIYFFGNFVMVLFMWYKAHEKKKKRFKTKIFIIENWKRWLVSIFAGLFLLATVPEGIFMMSDIDWNIMFSGIVGLFPMYLFRKFMAVAKSKLRTKLGNNE